MDFGDLNFMMLYYLIRLVYQSLKFFGWEGKYLMDNFVQQFKFLEEKMGSMVIIQGYFFKEKAYLILFIVCSGIGYGVFGVWIYRYILLILKIMVLLMNLLMLFYNGQYGVIFIFLSSLVLSCQKMKMGLFYLLILMKMDCMSLWREIIFLLR